MAPAKEHNTANDRECTHPDPSCRLRNCGDYEIQFRTVVNEGAMEACTEVCEAEIAIAEGRTTPASRAAINVFEVKFAGWFVWLGVRLLGCLEANFLETVYTSIFSKSLTSTCTLRCGGVSLLPCKGRWFFKKTSQPP